MWFCSFAFLFVFFVQTRARVTYIDYEGRSDGDSIKKIINQMKPRQLVIVHGPPEASQDLAECCRAFGGKDIKVYMPKLHETVDATSETHIYQVRCWDLLLVCTITENCSRAVVGRLSYLTLKFLVEQTQNFSCVYLILTLTASSFMCKRSPMLN